MGARPAEVEYLSSYLREEPGGYAYVPSVQFKGSSRAVQGQFDTAEPL